MYSQNQSHAFTEMAPEAQGRSKTKKSGGHRRGVGHMKCKSLSEPNLVLLASAAQPHQDTFEQVPSSYILAATQKEKDNLAGTQRLVITVRSSTAEVLVVFHEAGIKKRLHREATQRNHRHGQDASTCHWSVPFADVGVEKGFHAFHFLVDGMRTLSGHHPKQGESNTAMLHKKIRNYIMNASDEQQEVAEPDAWRDRAASNWEDGVHKPVQSLGRPHTIGANLSIMANDSSEDGSSSEDCGQGAQASAVRPLAASNGFPMEVFEGLFDRELRLRLHDVSLPEAPAQESLYLLPGAWQLQKPTASECEDAYFIGSHGLGVADGVGGMTAFKNWGVNSAQYARQLMARAESALESLPRGLVPPHQMAQLACVGAETQAQGYGASTLAVLSIQGNTIGAANLGDSGFMVLRQGPGGMSIVCQSEEQQHGWNFPYQLMRLPPQLEKKYPSLKQDHACDAALYTYKVRSGDLVLMYSDGLRDNLHDAEILEIANRTLSPAFAELLGLSEYATLPTKIAKALALAAQYRSSDQLAKVPFYHYSKRHGYARPGGKEDDITVVAAWVVAEP